MLYKYSCTTESGVCIRGLFNDDRPFNRDELTQRIMGRIAHIVHVSKVPWDPFNVELIVRAQTEPKPPKTP